MTTCVREAYIVVRLLISRRPDRELQGSAMLMVVQRTWNQQELVSRITSRLIEYTTLTL